MIEKKSSPNDEPTIKDGKDVRKNNRADDLDFFVDFNIPSLDDIVISENCSMDEDKLFINLPPNNNDKSETKVDTTPKIDPIAPTEPTQFVDQYVEEIKLALIPELEKIISTTLFNALAEAIDNTEKTLLKSIRSRIVERLPQIIQDVVNKNSRQ